MKKKACLYSNLKLLAVIFGLTLFLLCVANVSFAKDITLIWGASPSPVTDVAGYKVYYGTSTGTYTGTEANIGPSPIDVGNTTSAALVGLDDTVSHYFTVAAYNFKGEESAYANEVNAPGQPNNDSDGDGFTDMEEVSCGSNPTDPSSRCSAGLPWLTLLLEDE